MKHFAQGPHRVDHLRWGLPRARVDSVLAEVVPYDVARHGARTVSARGSCAQGGVDTCAAQPVFSVIGETYTVAACDDHVAGALRQALGIPSQQ